MNSSLVQELPYYYEKVRYKGIIVLKTELSDRTDNVRHFQMFLECHRETEKKMWRVEYDVEYVIINKGTEKMKKIASSFFDHAHCSRGFAKYERYDNLIDSQKELIDNNTLTVECRVKVGTLKGIKKRVIHDFTVPSEGLTNIVLKIGDHKLNVSKDLLAVLSPVLSALFFGKFEENNKDEIELCEIVYQEFVDLLNLMYPSSFEITARNVHHILKLADRFQVETVIERVVVYLMTSDKFTTVAKLKIAEQYRLHELLDFCINSFTSYDQVKAIKETPEFKSFSDSLARTILERVLQF